MEPRSGLPRFRVALGEFLIIVAGVLVALFVDEWRSDLQDRSLELQYASRLKLDLERDTARFAEFERGPLKAKAEVLGSFQAAAEGAADIDLENSPLGQIGKLYQSQFFGFAEAQSAVFREMESTGALRLLTDPSLRTNLASHYALQELMAGILGSSPSRYRELLLAAFPGDILFRFLTEETAPSREDLAEGIGNLLANPDFLGAVNAELAYCGISVFRLRESRARAESLLAELDDLYSGQ